MFTAKILLDEVADDVIGKLVDFLSGGGRWGVDAEAQIGSSLQLAFRSAGKGQNRCPFSLCHFCGCQYIR